PIALPAGRNGMEPILKLGYTTGGGNGPFGLGWGLGIPSLTRKTSHGIPLYDDERDTFVLAGAEDLVAVRVVTSAQQRETYYRPRSDDAFLRIRHVQNASGDDFWMVEDRAGRRSIYGRDDASQLFSDADGRKRIAGWYLSETADAYGNRIRYQY